MKELIPVNEEQRLAALENYNLLDTMPEEDFDRLTHLASIICGVPIALITLIDKDRQWFKSKIGLETNETSRDISFCQHTILGSTTFQVTDASKDVRFRENPFVTGEAHIRYYAGYPLTDPDGMTLGSLCVIDRTPRELTEEQLKALELLAKVVVSQIVARKKNTEREKLEKLFNYSIDMICIAGTDGFLKKVNPVFEQTLGWSEKELLTMPFLELVHPDDHEKTLLEIEKLSQGAKTLNFEARSMRRDGSSIILNWVANPDPQSGELFAIARDITEQVAILQELKVAKQLAENSVKIKDEFLSNMSHEIRTPLNAIIGFNDLLRQSALNAEQKRYVELADSASQNLMVIINDILDISKLESGVLTLEKRPIDLKEIAEHVISLQTQKARTKGIKLLLNIDHDIPALVYGDSTRVSQVLLNLVGNAVKFTNTGNVELKLMEIKSNDSHSVVRFTVKDSGIGIEKEKQQSIFERFSQAESSTTRIFGGTGLGLNIVKKLVDLQRGKIEVMSEPGKGSEFIVEIEYAKVVEQSAQQGSELHSPTHLAGMKVLVVDDNEHNQILATTYCNKNGAYSEVASNGQAAIDLLRQHKYHIILMDLQMPVMDGFKATRIIRDELKMDIPIVACSADSLVGERENCIGKGMNEYISKPYSENTLVSVLGKYLTRNPEPAADDAQEPDDFEKILKSLETEYGTEFVQSMTEIYKRRIPADIIELDDYLKQQNAGAIKAKVHMLAGSLSSLHFMKGHLLAKKAEEAATLHSENMGIEVKALIEYLNLSLQQIRT